MKHLLGRLKAVSMDNPAALTMLMGIFFIVGAFIGWLMTARIQGESLVQLTQSFQRLYNQLRTGETVIITLWSALLNALFMPVMVYIFSFSFFGLVVAPFAILIKGFILSVTVTAFVKTLSTDGFWLAGVVVGIPTLLSLPLIMIICVYTFQTSLRRIRAANKLSTIRPPSRMTTQMTLLIFGLFVLTAIYEAYAVPPLLEWLASRI